MDSNCLLLLKMGKVTFLFLSGIKNSMRTEIHGSKRSHYLTKFIFSEGVI